MTKISRQSTINTLSVEKNNATWLCTGAAERRKVDPKTVSEPICIACLTDFSVFGHKIGRYMDVFITFEMNVVVNNGHSDALKIVRKKLRTN